MSVAVYRDLQRAHLDLVLSHNEDALNAATALLLEVIRRDGLLLSAGAGHSASAAAELFHRAGGLACVRPVHHPDLALFAGANASTAAERRAGLADEVFAGLGAGPRDVLVVFSTSGVNAYPVQLAAAARTAGCPVIAVTSLPTMAVAPRREGSVLAEHADVVLDTLVRPGDASYPPGAPLTAALSTVVNAALVNDLLVRLCDAACAAGVELPLWRSANIAGGDEANAALLARFAPRIPELR